MRPLAILLFTAVAGAAAAADAPVLGTWVLTEEAADVVARNCRTLSYTFDASTITLSHGEMRLTTRYEVDGQAPQLSFRQVVTAYNARPGCTGAVLPYAVGQRIRALDVDLDGDRMRVHIPGRGGARHVDLVRLPR